MERKRLVLMGWWIVLFIVLVFLTLKFRGWLASIHIIPRILIIAAIVIFIPFYFIKRFIRKAGN